MTVSPTDWARSLYGYCRRCGRPRYPWLTDQTCPSAPSVPEGKNK